MEPYKPPVARNRIAAIHFPMPLWKQIQAAAKKAGTSASAWVRQACTEKLEQP